MRLSDACEINPRSQAVSDDTLVSFVAMPDVSEDGKINTSIVRPYGEVKKGYTVFQEGDILFAKITPCMENGKGALAVGLQNGIGVGSTEFHVLRPNTDLLDGMWLYYLTAWPAFRHEAEIHMTGSAGQKRVPKTFLERYQLAIPTLDEQKDQVSQLDRIRRIIDSRQRQLRALDTLIKARFVEMFGDPISNEHLLPMVTLSDLGSWNSGGTPSRTNPGFFEGDIDWYSAGELNSLYLEGSVEKITIEALNKSAAKLFPKGSMLVGMYDTAAFKMGILRKASTSNQACACIEPNDRVNILWLYYCLQIMKPHFLEQRRGIRQKNLNLGMIKSFQIPYADYEQQCSFAAFVSQVDKSKVVVQRALERAQVLFDSLMQEYFG